jgi:hypothetical protein
MTKKRVNLNRREVRRRDRRERGLGSSMSWVGGARERFLTRLWALTQSGEAKSLVQLGDGSVGWRVWSRLAFCARLIQVVRLFRRRVHERRAVHRVGLCGE